MINNKYIYSFSRNNTDFELVFTAGHDSTPTFANVDLESDCISLEGCNFVQNFDKDLPLGMEKMKSMEIEFNLEAIENTTGEATLVDAILNGTGTTTETITINTILAVTYNIPFDYANRVTLTDTTNNIIIFDGVQEIVDEKTWNGGKFKAVFNCIGAKTLTALRPLFYELNLSFSNIVSNNWTDEHTLYALEQEYQARRFYSLTGQTQDLEYHTFVSKTLAEIETAIETKATLLLRAYRRDSSDFSLNGSWYDALSFYSSTDTTSSSLDTDLTVTTSLATSDVRLICLHGVNEDYSEAKGILTEDGFGSYDSVYELYKELSINYMSKSYFEYNSTTVTLSFKRIYDTPSTLSITSNECEEIAINPEASILDFTKIRKSEVVVEDLTNTSETFVLENLGTKNNTFIESRLPIHNARTFSADLAEVGRREIGAQEYIFAIYDTNPSARFYHARALTGLAGKQVLVKVSNKIDVYYDSTNFETTGDLGGSVSASNQTSGLHYVINKVVNTCFGAKKQTYIEITAPYELFKSNRLGHRVSFGDLANVVGSSFISARIGSEFYIVSYEMDFSIDNLVKIGLFGRGL